MRAYHLTASGPDLATGLAALVSGKADMPKPGHGEVLLRQHAACLNYVDLLYLSGDYKPPILPLIPIMDGAGEIAAVGAEVEGFAVGDRVIPHMLPHWLSGPMPPFGSARARGFNLPGSLAEYAVIPASALANLPEHLSFGEAATLPTAATTAWNAVREGRTGPGTTVLITGTGGVSLFALQFAKASGATVIVTSSSNEKLERARALGADEAINYVATPAWDDAALALTRGRGVDLVIETAGAETFLRSMRATAAEGTIVVAGWRSGTNASLPINRIQQQKLRIAGVMVGSVVDFREMVRAVSAAKIYPVVSHSFDFSDARDAYETLAEGKSFGKIVINVQ